MNYELVTIITTLILGWGSTSFFIWSLHKDISDLKERIARLEGLFEGFAGRSSR